MTIRNAHIAQSKINGLGTFASSPIKKGTRIIYNFDRCMINHSDTPNSKRTGKTDASSIIASRNIKEGEEITEDYNKLKRPPPIHETPAMEFLRMLQNLSAIAEILQAK